MSRNKKERKFLQKPVYEGGLKAMRQFLKKEMKYPKLALQEKVEGTVYIKYTINYKGKVVDAKVISSLGHGCDEEAVRLVKQFEFKVGKNRGVKVKFFRNIQIHFRLPKQAPKIKKPKANKLQYNYTMTSEKPLQKKKKSSSSHYTININK